MDSQEMNEPGGQIVVGYDGSRYSERALSWAIAEARLRGAGLLIVHAFDFGLAASAPTGVRVLEVIQRDAQEVLDRAVKRARDAGVETEGILDYSPAAASLVRASEGAALLVVGTRGRGGLRGALLGSVSTTCVHHAMCPVLVVPPPNRVEDAQSGEPEAKPS